MCTEWYKCGLINMLRLSCVGPYETKEEADKDTSLYWTYCPTTLSINKYHPNIIKHGLLMFKHSFANTGTFIFKPKH